MISDFIWPELELVSVSDAQLKLKHVKFLSLTKFISVLAHQEMISSDDLLMGCTIIW